MAIDGIGDFETCREGDLCFIKSPVLEGLGFVNHGFFTRKGGVSVGEFQGFNLSYSVGDHRDSVEKNWEILSHTLAVPRSHFLGVKQVHGDQIMIIRKETTEENPLVPEDRRIGEFDAIVTDIPGLALTVRTADCMPILIVHPQRKVIGIVHAGWRGTALAIVKKTIAVLKEDFSCLPSELIAVLGPAIGPCCYQVDRPVYVAFDGSAYRREYLKPCRKKDRWRLDLRRANLIQSLEVGVREENITSIPLCTACRTDLFFSHRAEGGRTGRQVNFIQIKNKS